jgi:outer membrane protein assembly factor BamB
MLLLGGLFTVWVGPMAKPAMAADRGDPTESNSGLAHTAADVRTATASGDWTQFHNGPTREGYNSAETTLSPSNVSGLSVAWRAATGNYVYSSPAVANGVVYVGSEDGKLYAYAVGCASGGASCPPSWTATTGGSIGFSSPAVADGIVYAGSFDGKLYAYAVGCNSGGGTCAPLWTATTGNTIDSSPAVANGVVYVGSDDHKLYAYAVGCNSGGGTCTPLWTAATGGAVESSPAVANGVVYVGSLDGKLYAYAVGCNTGGGTCTPLWTATTGNTVYSSPAVADGVVYFGSGDHKLYAYAVGCNSGGGSCTPLWTAASGNYIISPPAVANGVVYFGSGDGKLYAYAVGCASGGGACTAIWTGTTGGPIQSSPAVANGVIYIGSGDHNLYAYAVGCNSSGGTCLPLWTATTGDSVYSSPAVANGVVYVGSDDGKLYAFSLGGTTPSIPGSAWYGGDGVNVCYPAGDRSSDYCGGQHYVVGDPRDDKNNPLGWWQCVELAQRFYKSQGWTWPDATTSSGTFIGVAGAADIKTWAKNLQAGTGEVSWHDNGSGYVPRAGDLIVTDRSAGNGNAGHVSIVDSTDPSKRKIKVVEQNHSPTGWAQYSYSASGQIARDGYINASSVVVNDDSTSILGTVHVEKSSTTATPAAGGSVNLPGGTQLAIGSGAAASSGTLALSSFDASSLPDPLTSGLQLSGDGASVLLPTLSSGSSATLSFSYDPSSIPSGWTLSIYQDGDWTALPTTLSNGIASAQVSASTGYALLVSPTHSTYVPLTPVRLVDSRPGTGQTGLTASLVHNTPASFIVTGRAGIPANAVAVTGNLTVTNQTSFGYLSLTPTQPTGVPATSTLNFPTGDNRANAVVVPLGSDGAGHGVLWVTYEGLFPTAQTDVIFDATGYFVPDDAGSTYVPVTPTRFVDSRAGAGQTGLSASLAYNAPVSFRVSARTDTGLPIPDNAVAVTGNLTVTNQSSFGYFSLTPSQPSGVPGTSTLNFPTGDNRANAVVVPLGTDGSGHRVIWITYEAISSSASADVVFDVTGYFVPGASGAYYVPVTPNRLVDSRPGADHSGLSSSLSYNAPASFVATDRCSGVAAANVPASAVAVTGNLTVTNQTSFGYLSLTPSQPAGTPSTSTLNFPVGDNRANAVIAPLGTDDAGHGALWITYEAVSSSASTDAVFDVTGYFVK